MRSLAEAATAAWFMPQFWEVLPLTIFVLLFGFVISVAVVRARREDIPGILAILSAFFSAIITRREYRSPIQDSQEHNVVTCTSEAVVAVRSKKGTGQEKE